MRPLILCAALVAAAPALAGEFDGVYKPGPDWDCGQVDTFSVRLKIENDIFYGVEMQCRMENPVKVRDMDAVLYDMACSGEGAAWAARALFMHADKGGLIMAWNGYAFQYERCPLPGQTTAEPAAAPEN